MPLIEIDRAVLNGKGFEASTDLITVSGTTETPIFLLKNPSSTGVRSLITHFLLGTDSASVRSIFRFYANPTVTADGTGLSESNTLIKSSPPSSDLEAFKNPTVSANGSLLNTFILPANIPSKGVNRTYWIEPGNYLMVTIQNTVSNAKSHVDINWIEGV